ncbi:hypothetical protein PS3A_34350 [Pseudomonas sp. 3A(2025)]
MAEPTGNKFTSDSRGEPTPMPGLLDRGDRNIPSRQEPPPAPIYTYENPPPRERYQPEPMPAEEPGFYIVESSQSPAELYRSLFDAMPGSAMLSFSKLNPGLSGTVKAGTLIVLSDPNDQSCTYAQSQLVAAAHEVKAALAPLSVEEADFMMRHAGEIAAFTGETSTWLGVSAAVMEGHLAKLGDTLKKIETHHQDSFRQHGHLRSPEFFTKRQQLLKELDAQLLNSKRVRGLTTFNDQGKLKNALGISSRSLVHHWSKAGAPGGIPGYASHVKAISRATTWMKTGGFIGIGIGGVSGLLAIQEVCQAGNEEACRKVKFVEGGKFLGASGLGFLGGSGAATVATPVCIGIGFPTAGIGTVACAVAVVGVSALVGTVSGNWLGELGGELLYESEWL